MNSYEYARIFVLRSLGLLLMYLTFFFCNQLPILFEVGYAMQIPRFVLVIIIIGVTGFALELGCIFFHRQRVPAFFLRFATLYAIFFLGMQIFLVIRPAFVGCKCIPLKDALLEVSDWSSVMFALGLLVLSMVAGWLDKSLQRIHTVRV